MPTVYALGAGNITISGDDFVDQELSGFSQGTGEHLDGLIITLENNNWESIDFTDNDPNFSDNDGSQRLDGAQDFDGTTYSNNSRLEAEYSLVLEDPDGQQYTVYGFNINEGGGSSFGTVEGLVFLGGVGGFPPINVPLTVVSSAEGPSAPTDDLAVPFCFGKGCMIETPSGAVPVETLKEGDWVLTVDRGAQQIKWTGSVTYHKAALDTDPRLRPVLLRRGSLGKERPSKDIHLSRQHRVLISGWQAELLFGEAEILVPALKLVNDSTILVDTQVTIITYYHILFEQHELLLSDGITSESFLPGLKETIAAETESEFLRFFPEQEYPAQRSPLVRPCVSDKRAALLAPPATPG